MTLLEANKKNQRLMRHYLYKWIKIQFSADFAHEILNLLKNKKLNLTTARKIDRLVSRI